MMKKLTALCGALVLAVSLSGCGISGEQLPALVLESSSAVDSTVESGAQTSSALESGAESEAQVEDVPDTEFEDSLEGLCDYFTANKLVTGEPVEMAYETIGATGGYRFRFTLNKSTVQVELYSYDLDQLNDQAQEVLTSVRENGTFTMLKNQVPATLNGDGKYMLLYTDGSKEAENQAQKERAIALFEEFYQS